jgi:predicted ester cyclase
MAGEDLEKVVRQYYKEVFAQRNIAVLDELFAPDFVGHSATPGPYDLADMRRDIGREHETMPEDETIIEDQVAEGDRVVTRFRYGWKHDRSVWGEPPSGRWITMEGIQIDRLEDGKIVERWKIKDQWGATMQLGGKVEFAHQTPSRE